MVVRSHALRREHAPILLDGHVVLAVVAGHEHRVDGDAAKARTAGAGRQVGPATVLAAQPGQREPDRVARVIVHSGRLLRRGRDGLVGDQERGPRRMRTLGVVAHVERDRAGPPGKVERLARIHRQLGDAAVVVDRLDRLAVADGDVVLGSHDLNPSARVAAGRRPVVDQAPGRVVVRGGAAHPPDDPVELTDLLPTVPIGRLNVSQKAARACGAVMKRHGAGR